MYTSSFSCTVAVIVVLLVAAQLPAAIGGDCGQRVHRIGIADGALCPATGDRITDRFDVGFVPDKPNILSPEYNFRKTEASEEYSTSNQQHGLDARMQGGRFTLIPRSHKDYEITFGLYSICSGAASIPSSSGRPLSRCLGNRVVFDHGRYAEEYVNDKSGIRQNFIVYNNPALSAKQLQVDLHISTKLAVRQEGERITFYRHSGADDPIMVYSDLRCWDARGMELGSRMSLAGHTLSLIVDIRGAEFPILVDPLSTTEDWQIESDYAGGEIGWSVSSAGDVNGDGYSDLIVGAPWYDADLSGFRPDRGKAWVYLGSSTGLATSSSWQQQGQLNNYQLGYDVAYAGDVNGDGYGDVIVGSNGYSMGQSGEGQVTVYQGSSTGLSTEASWSYESNVASASLGSSVSTAGDINDDGYSDIIVGAPGYTNGQSGEGIVMVFLGSSSGVSSSPDWSYEGGAADMALGTSVACAGDINGDGYSDVVIGAPGYSNSESGEGQALLFCGSSSGLAATADWAFENNSAGSALGTAVFGAGDVDGDGYGDLIVGAPQYTNGQSNEGIVYLFLGSSSGPGASADWSKESNSATALFGGALAAAGDINGDGYADIIIGASEYENGETNEGLAEVYLGSAGGTLATAEWSTESGLAGALYGIAVSSAGDINGDGYSDIAVGASDFTNGHTNEGAVFVYQGSADIMSSSSTWSYESDNTGSGFSSYLGYSVSTAGDVNGDGYDDVLVAAPYFDNGHEDEGKTFVFHGSSSGLSSTPAWSYEGNLAKVGDGVWLGYSLGAAGDVNGDGYDDIIVGAPGYENGQTDEGHVFVFKGSGTGLSSSPDWTFQNNQEWAIMGRAADGAGDVNGDGYDDIIFSAPGQKTVYVHYGSSSGPSASADWSYTDASQMIGDNVASAGDVNGDGFSDILFSSINFTNGQSGEGRAFLFYGSSGGLASTPDWTYEIDQAAAYLGTEVNALGDVNGDGFSDIGIAIPQYDSDLTNEGAVHVFYGSSSGLASTPDWSAESNHVEAPYSNHRVASAGDVNGDGYSDLLFSTPNWDDGAQFGEGKVWLFLGGESGLESNAALEIEGNVPSLQFGGDIASAGDVNGDGYSDVIIGAYNYTNGQAGEGAVFCYLGNGSQGVRNNLYLMDDGATSRITASNRNSPTCVLRIFCKAFTARVDGRLVWECIEEGNPFSSASPIGNSTASTGNQSAYSDLGTAGAQLSASIVKVGSRNKVRVRLQLDPVKSFTGQVYLPWKYPQSYLRGSVSMSGAPAADVSLLPVEYRDFYAVKLENRQVNLIWVTSSELSNDFFSVERSHDGVSFNSIGTVSGHGTTDMEQTYSFIDGRPGLHMNYYRLKQVDYDGTSAYSDIIAVDMAPSSALSRENMDFRMFPNPCEGAGFSIALSSVDLADSNLQIHITDVLGRTVYRQSSDPDEVSAQGGFST